MGNIQLPIISTILKVPSKISLRKSIRILDLTHKYDSSRIEAACLRASTFDNFEYKGRQIFSTVLESIQTRLHECSDK